MSVLRILQLVGSAENEFFCDLSRLYAEYCLAAMENPRLYDFKNAYITPDYQWRFPKSLSQEDIAAAEPLSLSEALKLIKAQNIDLVLPQMYCIPGMTTYRALFDLLKIPYIGNKPDIMALTAHKGKAKAIAAAAGVKVPVGEILRRGDTPTIKIPAVIKPVNSDNSAGVTLVNSLNDYEKALNNAFEHSNEVIVEEYIELGREVRCGIIVKDGQLLALPLEEYPVNDNHPIRHFSDKFNRTEDGKLAKDHVKSWIVDPEDPITKTVQEVAKQCHQALGCRHYSLFDFRVDSMGQPWFLEAGLYCSFSPKSVIVTMAKAAGIPLTELFTLAIQESLRE
jgi:D-alanine-D-alanine ligase